MNVTSAAARPSTLARLEGPGHGLIDRVGFGLALVDATDWTIRNENQRFRLWFPAVPGPRPASVGVRIPGFDEARARERLASRRPYRLETQVDAGARPTAVLVEVRLEQAAAEPVILVEVQNITKQKEAEYMLESYSRMMERQARLLAQEKERAERLLLNIMPRSVAAELRDFGTTTPQLFDAASVLMLDFVGFTEMAIAHDPGALIAELNDIFTSFDRICEHCGCERIKTIGDAYMAVSGLPEPDPDHEFHIARAALRMRRFLERRNGSSTHLWQCRIGIGRGKVIGSIVGVQKYVYDIFGPAVNLAARLEALSEPMQVLISSDIASRLDGEFVVRSLGSMDIKGFGTQEVFALEDEARTGR
jgi:adenylate cyclase